MKFKHQLWTEARATLIIKSKYTTSEYNDIFLYPYCGLHPGKKIKILNYKKIIVFNF